MPLERVSLYRHCNTVSLVFHFISFLFTILINLRFESTWSFWKQINSRYNEPFFYAISKFFEIFTFRFLLRKHTFVDSATVWPLVFEILNSSPSRSHLLSFKRDWFRQKDRMVFKSCAFIFLSMLFKSTETGDRIKATY